MVELLAIQPNISRNGTADAQPAMQAAWNYAASINDTLNVPSGVYRMDSPLQWPENGRIAGSGSAGEGAWVGPSVHCWFWLNHMGVGVLAQGGGGKRVLQGINTSRAQPDPAPNWQPIDYDFDIDVRGVSDLLISDCQLRDATRGIRIVGTPGLPGNKRIDIRDVTGQVFKIGIEATHIYDTCRWDNIRFWTYWANGKPYSDDVLTYQRANLEAFVFGRMDNAEIGSLFSYCSKRGAVFRQQASVGDDGALPGGATYRCRIASLQCDDSNGVLFEDGTDGMIVHFGRLLIANSVPVPAQMVEVRGANNDVFIGDLEGIRGQTVIHVGGSNNLVQVVKARSEYVTPLGSAYEYSATAGNALRFTFQPQNRTHGPVTYGGGGTINVASWQAAA